MPSCRHHTLAYLVGRLQPGAAGSDAATAAEWTATLVVGHLAKENDLLLPALASAGMAALLADMPGSVSARVSWSADWAADAPFAGALVEGDAGRIRVACRSIAALPGPLVLVQSASGDEIAGNADAYCLTWLLEEVSTSINTAAAGGNASLMAIG